MEARRSGNYGASIWDDNYVQSLTTPYMDKKYIKQAEKLKNEVEKMMDETRDETEQLELIDLLQRLHISHLFQDRVQKIFENIIDNGIQKSMYTLHLTALKFRLVRQHGHHVPQEVFSSFLDNEGKFKVSDDLKGVVSLYEASFLSVEGESIMDSARDFCTRHLKESVEDPILGEEVRHALELPLHWRVQKLEAKWFIHVYETRPDVNPNLLQLAKLDFNMVQSMYQDEIKRLSRWYEATGLVDKLSFARHRLAECFLWALGFVPDPHFGYSREILTKMGMLVTIVDDIYDVYGTLDELEVFTNTIQRWDINALDGLPEYMRICFLAVFNTVNEMGYHILRDQGFNIIPILRKLWAELGRAYYVEATWFHTGYFPTVDEYLSTAWVSASGPLLLFHAYFSFTNPINEEELQSLEKYPGIIHWPSMVLRLADDLGTSSDEIKRGDVPKSIQCYMRETGCCEEDAREHVNHLIQKILKKMNKEILMEKPCSSSKNFGPTAMNLARISLCYYQFGDAFGVLNHQFKKNLVSLVAQPIPMHTQESQARN